MKNLINLWILIALFSIGDAVAGNCYWQSEFEYPKHGKTYEAGKDMYTLVVPQHKDHIASVELYINGRFIRKETSYPFEWCKGSGNSDQYLRNLKPGTYKLRAKIRDKCGGVFWQDCTFYVKQKYQPGGRGNQCDLSNPLKDLEWLRKIHQKYPDHIIALHNSKGRPLFRIYPCSGGTSYWYDCEGNRKPSSQGGARFIKYIYKNCAPKIDEPKENGPTQTCESKGWFRYPKNNGTYRYGKDVYVRFDVAKYQDIAYVELYVNGKFVRKETSYPYEWCKGTGNSDSTLRNLKRGTYNLKARIKTKCGNWSEYFAKFYVR